MQRTFELCVSGALVIASVVLFSLTFTEQFDVPTFGGDVGPAFAPRGFLLVWMVLAVVATLATFRHESAEASEKIRPGQLFAVVAIAVVTALAMTRIGFVFATIPGFFLFCWAFGYRNWLVLALLSIAGPLIIWALFTFAFELLLPRSPWFHIM